MEVVYYAGATTYTAGPFALAPHKAGSLYIGSTSVPNGFAGSAVLSADVPIVATYVQFVVTPETGNYGRMMYNGFDASQAGTTFYVPTVLNFSGTGSTSRIGVQNIENSAIDARLRFYPKGVATPALTLTQSILGQASYVFSASSIGLPASFDGSLVITGTGRIVAASEETDNAGRGAYAFEGSAAGAMAAYMPTMVCRGSAEQQISYYAIQNTSTSVDASVVITYYNTAGSVVGTMPPTVIAPGGKLSRNPCQDGVPDGTAGSAQIVSTGAPIIAIGKVKANNGMATAFVGQASGATKVACPYVRWSNPSTADFRSYLAIMNVGSAPATNIHVKYYDGNGTQVADHQVASGGTPLNPFIKTNSNPSAAGALSGGTFGFTPAGGAVEITSDQHVVVVVRSQKDVSPALGTVTRFAEDYNGVPVP
jgi:hypothetical protein